MEESNISNFVLGAGGLGGILWAVYERITRMKVERASNGADIAASTGETRVYQMLTERLASVEAEVSFLREQLAAEREVNYRHQLELLQMRKACIEAGIPLPEINYGHNG